jgi:CrcB protein
LSGVVEKHDALSADARLFLFTGILGGFTTFSAFGVETITLFQRHEPLVAILNVILSVTAGLTALWFGIKIV